MMIILGHSGWDDDNWTRNLGIIHDDFVAHQIVSKFNNAASSGDSATCAKIAKELGVSSWTVDEIARSDNTKSHDDCYLGYNLEDYCMYVKTYPDITNKALNLLV